MQLHHSLVHSYFFYGLTVRGNTLPTYACITPILDMASVLLFILYHFAISLKRITQWQNQAVTAGRY